jgi:hypothetical protein
MGLSRSKQPQRPVPPNFNQPGFSTPQQGFPNPAQPGFQNQPTPGFPPSQQPLNQQQGMPNQPNFASNHAGFPGNQQPNFPPPPNGFGPNQPGFPTQSAGFGNPHGVFPPNHHGFPNHHQPGQGFSPFPAPPPPPGQQQQQPGYNGFPPPLFPPAANCAQVFPVNYGNQSLRPLIPGYASAPSHERRANVTQQEMDQQDYNSRFYTSDQIVSKSRKH